MTILKAEKRDMSLKAKHLRRNGIVPGVLYGSRVNEPLNLQFSEKDVANLLKTVSLGGRLDLLIGDTEQMALLKEIIHVPLSNKVEHLTFMPLIKGEKVQSITQIVLQNKENVPGNVQQIIFEISYKALPSDLTDKIEIDLENFEVGDIIRVEDLEISKNEAIEVLESPDSIVCSIVERKIIEDEETEDTEETNSDEE